MSRSIFTNRDQAECALFWRQAGTWEDPDVDLEWRRGTEGDWDLTTTPPNGPIEEVPTSPWKQAENVLHQARHLLAECKPGDPNCTSAMGLQQPSVPPNEFKTPPGSASGYKPFDPADWQSAVSHDYPPNSYTIPGTSSGTSKPSSSPIPSVSNPPPGAKERQPGGGVPLIQKPDGTWTSPDPAWAHLIDRESGGRNIKQLPSTVDVNTGGNEAYGLFQITPATWTSHGGQGSVYNSTPEQQAQVAAEILRSNPSGSDWGAGMSGREDPGALARGLGG